MKAIQIPHVNDVDIDAMFFRQTVLSSKAYERACRVMPGGNTRQTLFARPYPIYAYEAKGCRVTDIDGNERIDFVNNYSALIRGHGDCGIQRAVSRQLEQMIAVGLPSEAEIEAAELLCNRIHSVERVRFMNSGTEAVMMAIKTARAFTGRSKVAKIEGCYHGTYDYAEVSQSPGADEWGDPAAPTSVAYSKGAPQAVLDGVVVLPLNDLESTRDLLSREAENLAAVLLDPIIARMSYAGASPEYLELIRTLTREYEIVLILDEVYSLRLDFHGAQHKRSITPDLTVMGKIIGGGFPIGAVGGPASIMSVFDPTSGKPSLPHGGTFNANPITMAASLACMEQMTPEVFAQLNRLGEAARDAVAEVFVEAGVPMIVQGEGSVFAIVPGEGPVRNWRDYAGRPWNRQGISRFHRHLMVNGILASDFLGFVLSTPMGEAEIDILVDVIRKGVHLLDGG